MADSKSQQIIDKVKSVFNGITVANGYNTDLANRIYVNRDTDLEDEELPVCLIKDPEYIPSDEEAFIGYFRWQMNLEIQLIAAAGALAPANVRKMVQDVLKITGLNRRWNNLAVSTDQPVINIDVKHGEQIEAGATITLPIIYDCPQWEI